MTPHLYPPVPGEVLSWIMSDEPKAAGGSESNIQSTAQAVAAVVKEIPIYQDALQPGAKEIGEGLGGLLAAMMAPLQILGIKARKHVQEFKDSYEAKAEAIPPERLTPPDPMIMGPTLQALTYTAQEPDLREMFVSLLASASDSEKADSVHPSFVEVIRQLSPKDAEVLKFLSRSSSSPIMKVRNEQGGGAGFDVVPHILQTGTTGSLNPYAVSVENLERLKLFNLSYSLTLQPESMYDVMEEWIIEKYPDAIVRSYDIRNLTKFEGRRHIMYRGSIIFSEYGKAFIKTCL